MSPGKEAANGIEHGPRRVIEAATEIPMPGDDHHPDLLRLGGGKDSLSFGLIGQFMGLGEIVVSAEDDDGFSYRGRISRGKDLVDGAKIDHVEFPRTGRDRR